MISFTGVAGGAPVELVFVFVARPVDAPPLIAEIALVEFVFVFVAKLVDAALLIAEEEIGPEFVPVPVTPGDTEPRDDVPFSEWLPWLRVSVDEAVGSATGEVPMVFEIVAAVLKWRDVERRSDAESPDVFADG